MYVHRLCLLLVLACVGCRRSSSGQDPGEQSKPPPSAPVPSAAAPPPTLPQASALPQLKPIAPKPFPDGATEQMVCDAIDSKDPDPWLRFGHLVPAYLTGAIYVLETGPELEDQLYQYITRDYVYGYHSQQASCRGELTLLYIRSMFEESEFQGRPFGRKHLSAELEKRFGVKTRESFQFRDDDARLAAHCRANADLCEQLVKLDRTAHREGLCGMALTAAGVFPSETNQHLEKCLALPTSLKACAYYATRDPHEIEGCECNIRAALGLPLDIQCRRAITRGIVP